MGLGVKKRAIGTGLAALALVSSTLVMAADQTIDTAETATNAGLTFADGDSLTIANSGSLTISDGAGIDITAADISITNEGTITADNPGGIVAPPFATVGIDVFGDRTTITNTGSISASDFDAIALNGDDVTVTNSGTITGGIDAIYIVGDDAEVSNSGTLTVDSQGINVDGQNAQIINSGTITSDLDGIDTSGDSATITNSSSLTAGDDGIDTTGDNDVITNTGTITATQDGIETDGDNVSIVNSGTIIAGSDAFDINGADSTLTLNYGTILEGSLSFDGANGTLNIRPGLNAAFSTDGGNPTTVTAARDAVLQDGTTYYTFNLDPFRLDAQRAADLTQNIHETARANRGNAAPVTRGTAETPSQTWVSFSAGVQKLRSSSQSAGASTGAAALMAGLSLSEGFGFVAGIERSRSTLSNSFKTESDSRFAGLYGAFALGDGDVSWSLTAGVSENDSQRTLQNNTVSGGLETATAQYEQRFVSPAISYDRGLRNGALLEIELRYMTAQADGYTETGATTAASFGDRTNRMLALTPKVHWTTLTDTMPVDLNAGVEFRRFWGDPVDISVGAVNGSFASSDEDLEARAFIGATFDRAIGDGWILTVGGEAAISTVDAFGVNAALNFSTAF